MRNSSTPEYWELNFEFQTLGPPNLRTRIEPEGTRRIGIPASSAAIDTAYFCISKPGLYEYTARSL